jgi:hypothetical protein
MSKKIEKLLTEGLLSGYAGKNWVVVKRDIFPGESSHLNSPDGGVYHDEWFVGKHLGGGQELVKIGEESFTRLYGGGTPDLEILEKLGISTKDVGSYLIKKIKELGDRTRLFSDCMPEPEGDWHYSYTILRHNQDNLPITVSMEQIRYKGIPVHLHPFIISPIK